MIRANFLVARQAGSCFDRTGWLVVLGVFLFSGLLVGCGQAIKVDDGDIIFVSRAEFREALQKVDSRKENQAVVVDPRTAVQYDAEHLPMAINIPLPVAEADDPRIRAAKVIFVYGEYRSDPLAMAMCKKLLYLGYEDVRMYEGGLEDWRMQNLPLFSATDEN